MSNKKYSTGLLVFPQENCRQKSSDPVRMLSMFCKLGVLLEKSANCGEPVEYNQEDTADFEGKLPVHLIECAPQQAKFKGLHGNIFNSHKDPEQHGRQKKRKIKDFNGGFHKLMDGFQLRFHS